MKHTINAYIVLLAGGTMPNQSTYDNLPVFKLKKHAEEYKRTRYHPPSNTIVKCKVTFEV